MFLVVGIIGFAASIAAFWYSLPKNGRTMPLVGTIWEPYVAITITMGSILSFGAMAIGIFGLII